MIRVILNNINSKEFDLKLLRRRQRKNREKNQLNFIDK